MVRDTPVGDSEGFGQVRQIRANPSVTEGTRRGHPARALGSGPLLSPSGGVSRSSPPWNGSRVGGRTGVFLVGPSGEGASEGRERKSKG